MSAARSEATPESVAAWDEWDDRQRRALGIFGWPALFWWERCDEGGVNIVARHWPHLARWSWMVSIEPTHGRRRFRPFWWYPTTFALRVWPGWELVLRRQEDGFEPSPKHLADAPTIEWRFLFQRGLTRG